MALTPGVGNGTTYVQSSDLVANYPAASLALANKVDTKLDNALTPNPQAGTTYTFALGDARQLVTATNAAAKTFTVPPQASVAWIDNSTIRVVNYGAGTLTIAQGAGVTVTNVAKTLAQFESAALVRTGLNAWTLVPFGGGSSADFSNAATGTYTELGINYKYITFTASGTLTVTRAGLADVLVIAGGGGASGNAYSRRASGGAGGYLNAPGETLAIGAYTVTVGAGGAGQTNSYGRRGLPSRFFDATKSLTAMGGGGGGKADPTGSPGPNGDSTGGEPYAAANTDFLYPTPGRGNRGAAADADHQAGGGAGGNATGTTAGIGLASTITGTSVTRAVGGGGTTGVSGGANTGTGGGSAGGTGGSGVVIVRVRV